jgi:hypothetical protein
MPSSSSHHQEEGEKGMTTEQHITLKYLLDALDRAIEGIEKGHGRGVAHWESEYRKASRALSDFRYLLTLTQTR